MKIETEDLKAKIKRGESLQEFKFWVDGTEYDNLEEVPKEKREEVKKILAEKAANAIGDTLNPHTKEVENIPLIKDVKKAILIPSMILGIFVSVFSDLLFENALESYDLNLSVALLTIYGILVGFLSGKISEVIYSKKKKGLLSKIKFIENIRKDVSLLNISIAINLIFTLLLFYLINLIS